MPFVAKATDSAIASIAARLMAGEPLSNFPMRAPYPAGVGPDTVLPLADPLTLADPNTPWFSVKEAVLPFARFPGVDTMLGPEMRSTGEVMGWDRTFPLRLPQGADGRGHRSCPTDGRVFISIKDMDKTARHGRGRPRPGRDGLRASSPPAAPPPGSTANGIASEAVNKVYEGRPNIVDRLKNGDIALVMNTTEGTQAVERQPRYPRRRALRQDPLLHHRCGEHRSRGGDEGAAARAISGCGRCRGRAARTPLCN